MAIKGAWAPSGLGGIFGCDGFGAHCIQGWTTQFSYALDHVDQPIVDIDHYFSTPEAALANATPVSITVLAGSTTALDVSIFDPYRPDNYGEMTMSLTDVTATPEPASLILFGSGLSVIGLVSFRRRAKGQ